MSAVSVVESTKVSGENFSCYIVCGKYSCITLAAPSGVIKKIRHHQTISKIALHLKTIKTKTLIFSVTCDLI